MLTGAPKVVSIVCPRCQRKIGLLWPTLVRSMAVIDYPLTGGRSPQKRFLLTHPMRVARNADHRCMFRREVNRAWVDRARELADRTGRVRLYPDEVDRA
jgi:hypothetical protein